MKIPATISPPALQLVETLPALERYCKRAGHLRLVQHLRTLRQYPDVLVVDFNWTNYAALLSSDGFARIPNLHPRHTAKLHQNTLLEAKWRLCGFQQHLEPLNPFVPISVVWQTQLNYALHPASLEMHRRRVLSAMWRKFIQVSSKYQTIITEALDVPRLYACPQKKSVIDDLGWHTLMSDVRQLTTNRNQHLELVSYFDHSLTCPECRHKNFANRQRNRFSCTQCGLTLDPDLVALLNLWATQLKTPPTRVTVKTQQKPLRGLEQV
jgi:Putative transposase DNA-binding domain